MQARGQVRLQPLATQLALDLSGFNLPALQPYVAQSTAMTIHSGQLGVKGGFSFTSTETKPAVRFAGQVDVTDLRTTDRALREDFIKWRALNIAGIDLSLAPDRLSIDRITARAPYARVIIAQDPSLNVTKVLNPATSGQRTADNVESHPERASGSRRRSTPTSR